MLKKIVEIKNNISYANRIFFQKPSLLEEVIFNVALHFLAYI